MGFFDKNKHSSSSGLGKMPSGDTLKKFFNKLSNGAKGYAYVHLNVRNFKRVNVVLGFDVGNTLLKNISELLQNCLSSEEMASQIVVDEFALLLQYENQEQLSDRIQKIMDTFEDIEITNDEVVLKYKCSFACGIYEITGKESSFGEISGAAKDACLAVKRNSDERYGFCDNSILRNTQMIAKLQPLVQDAFEKLEITPCFQVVYGLETKNITSADLLPKWVHPEFGIIDPHHFSSVIERTGNVLKLDLYLLEAACKTIQGWINAECVPIALTISISKFNLYQSHFVDTVMKIINQYQVPTSFLVFKIDACIVNEFEPTIFAVLTELHTFGISLAVDNFYKSHISLSMFYEFPIDILYLNQKFIQDAQKLDAVRNVLCSVLSLSLQSGVTVLAEPGRGSQNEEFLKQIGCEFQYSTRSFDAKSVSEIEELIS